MAASTLALGQATYELLEALDGGATTDRLEDQRIVETIRADRRGGLINNLSLGVREGFAFGGGEGLGNILSLNIADASRGLRFNDSDAATSLATDALYNHPLEGRPPEGPPLSGAPSNANLNIIANTDLATLGLGGGDNRLNAARDLSNSEVQALEGSDTVRIGGRADGTFISLGAGADQLTVGRSSYGLDVDTGSGNDSALFLGTLTASGTAPRSFTPENGKTVSINQGSNLINLGSGDDKALFRGGIQDGYPGRTGYEIQLGAGEDTVEFGRGSSSKGFVLNTGIGSDNVTLGAETTNAVIDLGWDNDGSTPASGDSVVLGAGALLQNSGIRSGQSRDELMLGGRLIDTSLDLGWGEAFVEVSGSVVMGSNGALGAWDLGDGSDTLVFRGDISDGGSGGYVTLGLGADIIELDGTGYGIEFDLGNDDVIDEIRFGDISAYSDLVISNFGFKDILWIGQGKYGYNYEFLNEHSNEQDLDDFRLGNNVIWSQLEDSRSIAQEVMTLDTKQFEDESLAEINNPYGVDDEAISTLAEISEWVGLAYSSPLSSTEPTPEPFFPDTNNAAV